MSHEYKIQVEVNPVYEENEGTVQALLEKWGMKVDGRELVSDYTYVYWGHLTLSGLVEPFEAQANLVELLDESGELSEMPADVITRWRCIDDDQWDMELDSRDDEEKEAAEPAVL